jgi:dTDP-D-glucose 4,6-dehydratase
LTTIEIVKKIYQLLNVKNNFEIRNTSKGEIKNQRLNFVKIKKDLNWRPTISISSGLKKTIKWYKKNIDLF